MVYIEKGPRIKGFFLKCEGWEIGVFQGQEGVDFRHEKSRPFADRDF